MLFLSVFIYTAINAFVAGDSVYQAGFEDLTANWNQKPVIKMQWTEWNTACPDGWEVPPFRDSFFHPVRDATPVTADQKKLCLLRNGLLANGLHEGSKRPRSQCAEVGLQVCMQGKFPYCGKKDTPCPLVDVKDFAEDDKTTDMRHVCLSHIPNAYLPWTGCRPITDVVVASDPPCFKYSVTGITRTCVQRDTRYRFLKSLPFFSGPHVAKTPDTGVYYRNEIFYNPKCSNQQDAFEKATMTMSDLLKANYACLGFCVAIALLAGLVSPVWNHHGRKHQKVHLAFRDYSCCSESCWTPVVLLVCRLVLFVLYFIGIWDICEAKHSFVAISSDPSCVDPLVGAFLHDFVHQLRRLMVWYILSITLLVMQLLWDFAWMIEWTASSDNASSILEEAAPLFRKLPAETEAAIAAHNGIKYVYVTNDRLAAAKKKTCH